MEQELNLEFWADSFHEGFWACEQLGKFFHFERVSYEKGFIPVFAFRISSKQSIKITVLGSYKSWSPLPIPISNLLEWGKPDLIAFDPASSKILFALEETAAVPTGNQALQRCERMYGSLRSRIPYWYLLGEFGLHVDGGIRRDSIWPSVMALKLSCIQRSPCVVLHYSDVDHPEDYTFGNGVDSLFRALAIQIGIHFGFEPQSKLAPILTEQYQHMINFIESQGSHVVSFIPKMELLKQPDTAKSISELVTSAEPLDNSLLDFFNWGTTDTIPREIYSRIRPGGYIKKDSLIVRIEGLVKHKKAYTLSGKAGSKPQSKEKINAWIKAQFVLFQTNRQPNVNFSLKLRDFPPSPTGLHITTAKNVFYLIDSWQEFLVSLKSAYPRLRTLNLEFTEPVFLYISNSLLPGRIFGDPFTGQLSAFSNIFARNVVGQRTRIAVAYYPHQVHTQLFDSKGAFKKNKGITIMRELLDFAVFHGGVLVNLKNGSII